ncbi:MAG: hypothetical protein AWU54_83 [Candidatus Frackibacter sp. T328-2]|nr:MAG: hypothetical protein AWU54_83 [Candidatus Frackibacter sp. T328-2]
MQRKWIVIILILLISSGMYYGLMNDKDTNNNSIQSSPQKNKEQELTDEELPQSKVKDALLKVYNLDKTTSLRLKAEKMVQPSQQNKFQLKDVMVEVYQGQGNNKVLQATLTAKSGLYFPKDGRLKFFSPLSISNEEIKVQADTLSWNQRENRWFGRGNITIIHKVKGIKLSGEEFTSFVDLDRLEVKGNVRLKRIAQKEGVSGEAAKK